MNSSPITQWRLVGIAAVVGALVVLTAPSALADPPNHPRFATQAQAALVHQPEIVPASCRRRRWAGL
jgi:hypothetical protein